MDEFQDTNNIQYEWVKLLAGNSANVMIVGDDDQSIYGWRGAKIDNIYRFLTDYPRPKPFGWNKITAPQKMFCRLPIF